MLAVDAAAPPAVLAAAPPPVVIYDLTAAERLGCAGASDALPWTKVFSMRR